MTIGDRESLNEQENIEYIKKKYQAKTTGWFIKTFGYGKKKHRENIKEIVEQAVKEAYVFGSEHTKR